MKYIHQTDTTTLEDLKNQYKNWSKKLHPDAGGTDQQFQDLQMEYNQAVKNYGKTNQVDVSNLLCEIKKSLLKHAKNAIDEILTDLLGNISKL